MSIYRRAAKSDTSRGEIVDGLRAAHVEVFDIRVPCDLLCYFWSAPLQEFRWQTLEIKTPYGKKAPKARTDSRQKKQTEFLARTQTPVVTTLSEALRALGLASLTPYHDCGPS